MDRLCEHSQTSADQYNNLLQTVSPTKLGELRYDKCLTELSEFVEHALKGKSIQEGLRTVEHHLAICPECQEEYQAPLVAMKDEE